MKILKPLLSMTSFRAKAVAQYPLSFVDQTYRSIIKQEKRYQENH